MPYRRYHRGKKKTLDQNEENKTTNQTGELTNWRYAYAAVYGIAGLNLILGAIGTLFNAENAMLNRVVGAIFLILGGLVQQKSRIALGIALAIYALDSVFVVISVLNGASYPYIILIIRGMLIVAMINGLKSTQDIQK